MEPDPWQAKLLRSSARYVAVCCSRQSGKTCTVAALALNEALIHDGATCLILSPTERQSKEFLAVAKRYFHALGQPRAVRSETELQLHLGNGSRLIGLPENERGVRTYSAVRLLAVDEAARVDDALYAAIRPMLAVSGGRLIALSTPFGMRGWFWEEWDRGKGWERYRVTAEECPRIPAAFLANERLNGERYYRQEFGAEFAAAAEAYFDPAVVRASVKPHEVLFG
jgi:hypothetical protein